MPLEFHQFQCLSDNFGVLAHDPVTGATASLDAPEAAPILAALKTKGWSLTDIWLTHHHPDHIGAVGELKAQFPQALACGFDEVEIPDVNAARQPVQQWLDALGRINLTYQRDFSAAENILDQRRRARTAGEPKNV